MEVVDVGSGDKSCTLIYSKNPSLNYDVGDTLNFEPKVLKSESISVIAEGTLKFSFEDKDADSFEQNILNVGDKFAFTCQSVGCEDGILSWCLGWHSLSF